MSTFYRRLRESETGFEIYLPVPENYSGLTFRRFVEEDGSEIYVEMKNRGQWESADNAASFQSPCPFYAPEPVAPESKYATSMSSSRTGGMGSDSTPSFVGAGTPKSGYYDVSKTAALMENRAQMLNFFIIGYRIRTDEFPLLEWLCRWFQFFQKFNSSFLIR